MLDAILYQRWRGVSSRFRGHNQIDGKPLPRAEVQVTSYEGTEATTRFSGLTASDGTVRVTLPEGAYWLHTGLLGISAGGDCFHVAKKPSRNAKKKVVYTWGRFARGTPLIRGKLTDAQPGEGGTPLVNLIRPIQVPIIGSKLTVTNPLTRKTYLTTTGQDGSFAFEDIPNGIYVLHGEGGITMNGHGFDSVDVLLHLNPTGRQGDLMLVRRGAGAGSCGGTSLE